LATQGHPSAIIIHLASFLTEFLELEPQSEYSPDGGVAEPFDTPDTGTFIAASVRYVFSKDKEIVDLIEASQENSGTDGPLSPSAMFATTRETILSLFHSLSLLMHWPHNRMVMATKLGPSFAQEMVGLVIFFSTKIDELTVLWLSARSASIPLTEQEQAGLLDDTQFVISCLLGLIRTISYSCPPVRQVSEAMNTGFFAPQPWLERDLHAMGFDMLRQETHSPETPLSWSSDPSSISTPAFSPAMNAFHVSSQADIWSWMLINAGVDSALLKLLRKIVHFSKILVGLPMTRSESSSRWTKESTEDWAGFVNIPWENCTILQNEVLFALLCILSTHPDPCTKRFNIFGGSQLLNMIICETDNFRTNLTERGVDLIFHRGVLCLRLHEMLNQYFSVHYRDKNKTYIPGDSTDHTTLTTESIGWFLSWARAAYRYEDEYLRQYTSAMAPHSDCDGNHPQTDLQLIGENVVVGCVQTPQVHVVPFLESDLWPWCLQDREGAQLSFPISDESVRVGSRVSWTNYRLCHACSEDDSYECSTKSTDQEFPNVLNIWSKYVEEMVHHSPAHLEPPAKLPWFLCGKTARVWQIIFSILANTCLGKDRIFTDDSKQTFDSRRYHILTNFITVWGAVLLTLNDPIDQIYRKLRHLNEEDSIFPTVPMFEVHFLLFVSRCMIAAPVSAIEACCEEPEIWSSLFSPKLLLGGKAEMEGLIRLNHTISSRSSGDAKPLSPVEKYISSEGDSLIEPCLRCGSNSSMLSDESILETLVGMSGYTWAYVHDFVLDLTSIITSVANSPPANRVVSAKRSFDIKPIIHALQTSSESGYDSVTFQLLRWMKWYLDLLTNRSISVRNSLSSQFFRAALAVCGYHLGDVKASSILHKEHLVDPMKAAHALRPFMWSSRRSALEIVIKDINLPGCDRWLKLFSIQKGDQDIDPKGPNSRQTKSPAHVTLMLLFVDVRMREVLCYIIMRVLARVMSESLNEDGNLEDEGSEEKPSPKHAHSPESDKKLPSRGSTKQPTSTSKDSTEKGVARSYGISIRDLFLDLFELVKWSSRQPDWYDGPTVALCILSGVTQLTRSYRHSIEDMKNIQKWIRKGPIIPELISCLIACINSGNEKWTEGVKVAIIRQGLCCLSALMAGDVQNKSEFKAAMMTRRTNRSLSSSTSSSSISSVTSFSSNSSVSSAVQSLKPSHSIVLRFDEFNETILRAESVPGVETMLVLMEMLFEAPIPNSRSILERFASSPQEIEAGYFADQYDRPQIRNTNVIPIIFGILSSCDSNVQNCVLNSLHQLIVGRASLVNMSICSQMRPSLMDVVLDQFPLQAENVQLVAVKLLQALGKHSITVAQLKRIFQMMRSTGESRPHYTTLLLKSVQGMIDDNETPRHSFVFSGNSTGLVIPSIPRWPAPSAYTFSLWFQVESPQLHELVESSSLDGNDNQMIRLEYRPYILSLRCANKNGIEIFLKKASSPQSSKSKFRLFIRCHHGDTQDTFQVPHKASLIVEGKWYYLAVSHRSSGFRSHSEVEVMLDDQFYRHKLAFPRFDDVIENPLLGDCCRKFRDPILNTTMRGQVSAMYLFTEALTEGQLRGIHALGPSYFYSFEPFSVVQRDIPPPSTKKKTVDPILSVLDGSLTPLIALAYNPAVWKGELYLDNTPEKNAIRWKQANLLTGSELQAQYSESESAAIGDATCLAQHAPGKMHARALPGTHRSTTIDIRTVLNSLGGIRVLLPLFTQFDQPRSRPAPSLEDPNAVEILTTVDPDICLILLDMLHTLFVKTSENEAFLKDFQGFALISYFFERMSPQHLTMAALEMILRIREKVSWNLHYADDLFVHLLLNFKIWTFTSFEVQQCVLLEIEKIIVNMDTKLLRELSLISRLLDALYLLYDYDKPPLSLLQESSSIPVQTRRSSEPRGSFSTDSFSEGLYGNSIYLADKWIHASSGRVEGEKLTGRNLRHIRSRLLRLVIRLIRRGNGDFVILKEDIALLVRYAVVTTSSRSKQEILKILIQLLDDHMLIAKKLSDVPSVLGGLALNRGMLSILSFLSDEDVKVRLLTLLILSMALRQSIVYPYPTANQQETRDEIGGADSDATSDALAALGFPLLSLGGMMLWVQDELMAAIKANSSSDLQDLVEGCVPNLSVLQASIVAQVLQLTLLGERVTHLVPEILSLYDDFPLEEAGDGEVDVMERPSKPRGDIPDLHRPISSRFSLEKPLAADSPIHNVTDKSPRTTDSLISFPMILPSILSFLRSVEIPISLRLAVIVDLRTSMVQHSENCDRILRVPTWQDYFFQTISAEKKNVEMMRSTRTVSRELFERYLSKSDAFVDTCLRTLCDVLYTAVRIGGPIGPPKVYPPLQTIKKFHLQISLERIYRETKSEERQLGVSVLRETMACLRLTHDSSNVDMNPTAFNILQQVVSALQRESEMLLLQGDGSNVSDSDDMKLYFQRILCLNIWLVGALVLEFLVFPLNSKGVEKLARSPSVTLLPLNWTIEPVDDPQTESIDHLLSNCRSDIDDSPIHDQGSTRGESSEDSVWSLVESLLHLLGPLGPIGNSPTSGPRKNSSSQVSYLTGQKTSSSMDDAIQDIILQPSSISSSARMNPSHSNIPLHQAAEGVCWIMIRLLCSLFTHGGLVGQSDSKYNRRALAALLELQTLVNTIQTEKIESGLELAHVVARLSMVLQSTRLPLENEWVKGAVELLMQLLSFQQDAFKKILIQTEDDSPSSLSVDEDRKSVSWRQSFKQSETIAKAKIFGASAQPSNKYALEYSELLKKYSELSPDSYSISDVTIEAIRRALDLPSTHAALTWERWSPVVSSIIQEASAIENNFINNRLTELGLHKHSEEVRTYLDRQRSLETEAYELASLKTVESHSSNYDSKMKSLRDGFRISIGNHRRIMVKWNEIISRLANERGPWGYSSDDKMEVFWKMDPTETNLRMHHVLIRNEAGTRHQMGTSMARGKAHSATLSSTISDVTDLDNPFDGAHGTSGTTDKSRSLGAVVSPQGLWRDLIKYQKSSSHVHVDLQMELADKVEVEEVEEEAKDAAQSDPRNVLFTAPVEVIINATNSSGGSTQGMVEVTNDRITFTRTSEDPYSFTNKTGNSEFLWACECVPTDSWHTNEIYKIFCRAYQLRFVAIEIFFTSRTTLFLNLFDHTAQRNFYDIIRRIKPPHLQPHFGYRPSSIVQREVHPLTGRSMTQAWMSRTISNFEYLMWLNTVAGRSFNDMSQYPVFPWIIANYTSQKLALTDPKTFRDLRWSMGAQHEHQRRIFQKKYRDLEELYAMALDERKNAMEGMEPDCLPPFHYGSHYSTMGFVLWYLIRQEPFTSLNIWMQDGRFDKPDRIFDTIEMCWRGCTSNQSDVKELIPEFFYCPNFLENANGISLGVTTAGKSLGPVGLPPWAKNAQDFIRQNRNALESEYVSTHLHHWIDLIFGYKQRPPHLGGLDAAVEACNVYFHLTYAGAVDLDDLRENDVPLYNQMVRQIDNYGQTPCQLFTKPHPARSPLETVDIFWPLASVVLGVDTIPRGSPLPERPRRVVCFKEYQISAWPIVLIAEMAVERLITVDTSRLIALHSWQIRPPDVVPPFQFRPDAHALRFSQGPTLTSGFNVSLRYNSSNREKRVGVPFAPQQLLRSDFIYDTSTRRIRLPPNNKQLFEKDESTRSNWRVKPHHLLRPSGVKQSELDYSEASAHEPRRAVSSVETDPAVIISRVDEHISPHLFALLPEHRLLFSCGHWDYSFKATTVETGRLLQSVSHHRDVVTCMELATDFGQTWLVTGSRDCTLIIWQINPLSEKPICQPPLHVLYGHDDAVNCVSVNVEMDLVASGSDDGTIILHKLRDGVYIRSISVQPPPVTPSPAPQISPKTGTQSFWKNDSSPTSAQTLSPQSASESKIEESGDERSSRIKSVNRSLLINKRRVHFVTLSTEGFVIAYSNDDSALYTFSVNGAFQARKMSGERLYSFCLSEDHKVLVTGGERALLVMRWIHSLELSNVGSKWDFESVIDGRNVEEEQKPFNSPIRSIYLTKQERHLLVGLESGELRILAQVLTPLVSCLFSLLCPGFRLFEEKTAHEAHGDRNPRED
jgi:hypothetical protein